MRIIAGIHKGRQLKSLSGEDIRPTLDKVKEAVFSILQWRITGSVFVDLFSGSGNIGAEAISRGAAKVFFSENYDKALDVIRDNLLKIVANPTTYKIMAGDYKRNLSKLTENIDIIYADPPYESVSTYEGLPELVYPHLADDGLLVMEYSKKFTLKSNGYEIIADKQYGSVKILVLKKCQKQEI